ncbi:MAG: transglutaminase domain-containing protein, partial [Clostridia bacterium]|nr:transglutaminase domain-containing protein [Deltaproteobacteria bacterium]
PVAQPFFRPNGEVDINTSSAIRYSVFGATMLTGSELSKAAIELATDVPNPWLAVPSNLDPRIAPLALETIGKAITPFAKADALRNFLVKNFSYTIDQPNGGASDPLSAFLFVDRRGHCEYFAAAFAAMLRTAHVPARVVGGFEGGAWDDEAKLAIFTTEHAHAWVEWYDEGVGWVLDDATPPGDSSGRTLHGYAAFIERVRRSWDDYVVDYGLAEQFQIFAQVTQGARKLPFRMPQVSLKNILLAAGAFGLVAMIVHAFRKRSATTRRREHPLTRSLLRALEAALGEPLRQTQTLREGVDEVHRKLGPAHELTQALEVALKAYERLRFGLRANTDTSRVLRRLDTARRHF